MRLRAAAPCLTALLAAVGVSGLEGCTGHVPAGDGERAGATASSGTAKVAARSAERDCLVRAMYFESNRSSRDGLMAVGTVVMNRVASPLYPNTICGVVGEPRQFAPGVLTRPLNEKELPLVERAADAVLKGERHAPVGDAMHFHVAGLSIPYQVRYVAVAGGNAFYQKTGGRFSKAREGSSTEVAAARATKEATFAEAAPKTSLIDGLYASLTSGPRASPQACRTASSAFGGTPLTCEDEAAAR